MHSIILHSPLSNRGSSWLHRKVSNNLLKSRFSPKCKWHSVLTTTSSWFSLPNSRRPQAHPFSQPCTSHHLHSTRNVHCNLFSAFICCQHHSSLELCFICSACLFFGFFFLSLSCCVLYCASVHRTPLLPQQAGFPGAQGLCTAAQTVLTYMEQFLHLENVINLVHKRQTQYFHGIMKVR